MSLFDKIKLYEYIVESIFLTTKLFSQYNIKRKTGSTVVFKYIEHRQRK